MISPALDAVYLFRSGVSDECRQFAQLSVSHPRPSHRSYHLLPEKLHQDFSHSANKKSGELITAEKLIKLKIRFPCRAAPKGDPKAASEKKKEGNLTRRCEKVAV